MSSQHTVAIDCDEDGDYTWRCTCGVHDDCGDTYEGALDARRHHLEYHAATEFECAGLTPGKHWHALMMSTACLLAGDANEPFPDHLTKEDIHNLYVQARQLLFDLEPDAYLMCPECREWDEGFASNCNGSGD
jgi:hypothetical protein